MSRKYNFIYSKLVQGNDDLIGHIAYSLYKSKKISFIASYKTNNPNQELDESQLDNFHQASIQHLNSYRLEAQELLHGYNQATLDDYLERINKDTEEFKTKLKLEYATELKNELEKLKPRFWPGVIQSLIGSIGFTLFVGALIIFLIGVFFGVDALLDLFKMAFNTSVQGSKLPSY